ncbi:MAG: DUF2933 domain-containing protein [Alphaproteobacteria bacterium]
MNDKASHSGGFGAFLGSRAGLVLVAFLAIAGYFLWTEHKAHAIAGLSYLPFLLLLACPLMHIFMHGGHGGHDGGHDHGDGDSEPPSRREGDVP